MLHISQLLFLLFHYLSGRTDCETAFLLVRCEYSSQKSVLSRNKLSDFGDCFRGYQVVVQAFENPLFQVFMA